MNFEMDSPMMRKAVSQLQTDHAKKSFQRVLFEAYGGFDAVLPGRLTPMLFLEDGDDLDDDDFPELLGGADMESFIQGGSKLERLRGSNGAMQPASPTKNKASQKAAGRKCPVGAKPNCPKLLDKLNQMKGEIVDALNIKT